VITSAEPTQLNCNVRHCGHSADQLHCGHSINSPVRISRLTANWRLFRWRNIDPRPYLHYSHNKMNIL